MSDQLHASYRRTSQQLQTGRPRSFQHDLLMWLREQIAMLYPGCFALVMATGIISNALFINGHRELSQALFAIILIVYLWLLALTILRCIQFQRRFWADLVNPRLVFSFFTIVAGTDVLGVGINCADSGQLRLRCGSLRSPFGLF
jgi:hypothetical protein